MNKNAGLLHHVELYVSDLKRTREFWDWFLSKFGYEKIAEWQSGVSWKRGETYIVFVQTEDRYKDVHYHRCRTGLNHLAFHAESKKQVDELHQELKKKGVKILYEDKHPYAGERIITLYSLKTPTGLKLKF